MERTTLSCRHLVFPGRAPLVVICCSRSDIVTFPLASQPDTTVLLNSRPKESWFSEGCEGCHKALLPFEGSGAGPGLEARTAASSIANALGRCLIGAPRNSQPEHCSSRLSRAATPQSSRLIGEWGVHQCRRVACKGKKTLPPVSSVPTVCMRKSDERVRMWCSSAEPLRIPF